MKDLDNKPNLKTKDHLVTGEKFELMYDSTMDMFITDPIPDTESLPKYYKSEAYISHSDANKSIIDKIYQVVKRYSIAKKVTLITKENNGAGSLLDVGAGTGGFLVKAKSKGWEICGIEVNNEARNLATKKGVNLIDKFNDLKDERFDVITLWHVLEHLPDLNETIVKLNQFLNKNGTLIIAVPNFKSYDARYYKAYWAAYDVPRHIWHFSKKAISILFKDNFKIHKTLPMIFDSFYVSLLSEKHKTGKSNFIKALFIGLRSNISAWNTKEYSSHIYILKKK